MKKINFKSQNRTVRLSSLLVSLVILSGFFLLNCTENPFDDEKKISQNTIRGKVELINHSDPKDVFVWFEALNVNARTDSTGDFALTLPTPSQQPSGGIDGIFNLYFYVSNYQLDSVKIAMVNGNIQYDDQALGNDGKLKETIVLSEILNINTSFSSKIISESLVDTIYATFTVFATSNPVKIFTDNTFKPEFMSGFLLNSEKEFVKLLRREDNTYYTSEATVGKTAGKLNRLTILLPQGELLPGDYYVVPYIYVDQDLPDGLIESIGQNVTKNSQDFMRIPLKIHNNKLSL
jgi:hypothetical protein